MYMILVQEKELGKHRSRKKHNANEDLNGGIHQDGIIVLNECQRLACSNKETKVSIVGRKVNRRKRTDEMV